MKIGIGCGMDSALKPAATKERLLAFLENHRGQSVSGEFLAGRLNVSRTAVWKAVKELEKSGYKISAATNKGYCLSDENDILSVQGISAFLKSSMGSSALAGNIFVYPSLESTNITAKQMAISGAAHGTVIIADHQTAGKGRYDRSFFSPQGHGVYMSFVLRNARFSVQTLVTAFTAVAVCEAVEALGKTPQIKWVNDVFLNGRKICGISTEAVTDYESGGISWIVVGIGVNFTLTDVPEELKEIVGAVFNASEKKITRNKLAAEIIKNMAGLDSSLENDAGSSGAAINEKILLEKYRARMLFLGEKINVISAGKTYEATALDIDEAGRLIVKTEAGEVLHLSSGEVSIRKGTTFFH